MSGPTGYPTAIGELFLWNATKTRPRLDAQRVGDQDRQRERGEQEVGAQRPAAVAMTQVRRPAKLPVRA
jgi:hypothetical protein